VLVEQALGHFVKASPAGPWTSYEAPSWSGSELKAVGRGCFLEDEDDLVTAGLLLAQQSPLSQLSMCFARGRSRENL